MADKRISQLIERTDIANNDVLPIVASGATTTNKVTISTIQDWMQDNLDVGVTSVGITIGSTGTDVNVSGSPITTSGNITINIPTASATARGLVSTGTQTFAGYKIFTGTIGVNQDIQLATQGTALNTFIKNINATGLTSIGSNGFGFNNANNIYFSGSSKGGGVFAFSNTGTQTYTLQDASGTLAFTSDLSGYVTLDTAQTITATKTFTTSGSANTININHTSGSGHGVEITKAGNGEGLRVIKTSGSGNAMTITGGLLSAEAGTFSGDLQSNTRVAASTGGQSIILTANSGGTTNRIETTGTLPLAIITSGSSITLAAGGTTPQITLASTGAVTLTGALNGTSASFSSNFYVSGGTNTNTGNGVHLFNESNFAQAQLNGATGSLIDFSTSGSDFLGRIIYTNSTNAMQFHTNSAGTPVLTLASTGAATFSSSVTINGTGNPALDVQGTAIIRGNGSAYATHYFTTSAANVAQYDQYDASGNIKNRLRADGNSYITGGNVGIGTASPATTLDVNGTINVRTNGFQFGRITTNNVSGDTGGLNLQYIEAGTFKNGIVLNGDGNVGIGTANPVQKLHVEGSTAIATTGTEDILILGRALGGGASFQQAASLKLGRYQNAGGNFESYTRLDFALRDNTAASNYNTNTTVMTLTNAGNVGIGTTNPGAKLEINESQVAWASIINHTNPTDQFFILFQYNGTGIGNIRGSNTSTAYNTTSDYRLKENVKPVENALSKLGELKPCNFNFISEPEKEVMGFLAHEVQEVMPQAVHGQKDEVEIKQVEVSPAELDEEGNVITEAVIKEKEVPVYQGIDHSKLVPLLVAAIQEQQEQIKSLTEQVEALKSQING